MKESIELSMLSAIEHFNNGLSNFKKGALNIGTAEMSKAKTFVKFATLMVETESQSKTTSR